MKKFGTVVAWTLGIVGLVAVIWLAIAGFQGKTLKDTIPEDQVQQEVVDKEDNTDNTVEDENQDETVDPEVGTETTASINYDLNSNTICLG